MFIPKYHALSNEVAQKSKMAISNFSMLKKYADENDIDDMILKYANCTFVNTLHPQLPHYIRKACSYGYTDLENYMVTQYVCNEFSISKKRLLQALKPYDAEEIIIAGKSFIRTNDRFHKMLKDMVITNINRKDLNECLRDNLIDGMIELSKDNFLVWYSKY